jgi:hypothetical protein
MRIGFTGYGCPAPEVVAGVAHHATASIAKATLLAANSDVIARPVMLRIERLSYARRH